jgi:hypothetical protein
MNRQGLRSLQLAGMNSHKESQQIFRARHATGERLA